MDNHFILIFSFCMALTLGGCKNTDIPLATEAGIDAIKAVALSDKAVHDIAKRSSSHADITRKVAPPGNPYARRLSKLVGSKLHEDGIVFNYKVYLSEEINAFAMADGTIRIYSGLMDMLDNNELLFVIGHEMGHITKKHIHNKLQLAYAASAVRKGIASIDGVAGDIARSRIGSFVETIANAQFSQLEEKEADDYGLKHMKTSGYDPEAAVSALKKLATLGNNHSFLSSHPEPGKRAERLRLQLEGRAESIEESKYKLFHKIKGLISSICDYLFEIVEKIRNIF